MMEQILAFVSQPMFIYVGITLIVIVILVMVVRSTQLKQAQKKLSAFENRYNYAKSVPLLFKLNKSLALARLNAQINENVTLAKSDYNTVVESLKGLSQLINDTDDMIALGKTKKIKEQFVSLEDLLVVCESKVDVLSRALDEILAQEEKLRLRATELKGKFREVKQLVTLNVNRLAFGMDMIDGLLSETEKKFSVFEEWMYASEFAKANALLTELEQDIERIHQIINLMPEALSQLRGVLPKRFDLLQGLYQRLVRSGCYLEPLHIDDQLKSLQGGIKYDLDQLRSGNVKIVAEQIVQHQEQFEALEQQLTYEETCFQEAGQVLKQIHQSLVDCKTRYLNIKQVYDNVSQRYGFEDLTVTLTAANKSVTIFTKMAANLADELNQKQRLASDIVLRIRELNHSIEIFNSELLGLSKRLSSVSEDEDRARKQNLKLHLIINEILIKVRKHHLPSIADTFQSDLSAARVLIKEIDDLLTAKQIDITTLNSKLTDAIDQIYKFYNNVNSVVGTAMMVENAIVFGNKYRSSYPEVDAELTRAELAFRNGEYTNGLSLALPVLEKLFPENYAEMIRDHHRTL
jgi:septation ring formation regulator